MMILICLSCAVLAVLWAVPAPTGHRRWDRLDRAADSGHRSPRPSPGRRRIVLLVAVGSAVVLLTSIVLDGVRGGLLGLAVVAVGTTVAGLGRRRHLTRAAERSRVEVARSCSVLAAHLRVGQLPGEALALAAVDCPLLRDARDAHQLGGDVPRVWRQQARQPGRAGLGDLARAWQVSVQTGAPMAGPLERVAASLSADQSLRSVVDGELSAPRATGKVMAALPGCGIGLGYLLGGDPIHWLLGRPLGWGCLLAGVVLACLGVLWIEALARQATR
jgi:tight adherence protein B